MLARRRPMSNRRIRKKVRVLTALGAAAARLTMWPGNGRSFHDNRRLLRRDRVLQRQRVWAACVQLRTQDAALLEALQQQRSRDVAR